MGALSEQAQRAIDRCRRLAACTDRPGTTTRTYLSPAMRQAYDLVGGWMKDAGMQVNMDAVGNLRGLYGSGPRLLIGSHLDTVPDAGAFDGILGVMLALALVEARPRCSIEMVAFSEEEGVRFGTSFLGSLAMVGSPVMEAPVLDAIRAFGLDPAQIPAAAISSDVRAFLEFHIEQGPVLDQLGLPLAVVEGIVGLSRAGVHFFGDANHAGTTPMDARRDALAGAAEWIGAVETCARSTPGLVATVGQVQASPGASNVIPGTAVVSLDLRHAHDPVRKGAGQRLLDQAYAIATRRGLAINWRTVTDEPATPMNTVMMDVLADAVCAAGHPEHRMMSGAGHDAMILARKVPTAMLFLRTPNGVSHHPAETVQVEDVEAALAVGLKFLERWRPE